MLAVRRSACFYTTVGLCETTRLFFFLLLLAAAATATTVQISTRTKALPTGPNPNLHADTLLYLLGFIDY